jgi:hypothetical protein
MYTVLSTNNISHAPLPTIGSHIHNLNISGLSFGTFGNTTSKILREVTMVTNGGAQVESGI